MKALLFLALLLTLLGIALRWRKEKHSKHALIATGLLIWIVSIGYMGMITRPIPPLFMLHLLFVAVAWIALWWYIVRKVLMWWFFLLPLATIALFLFFEYLEGSRHEGTLLTLRSLLYQFA